MKYKTIEWELSINEEQNGEIFDTIAEKISCGETSGIFDIDITDYEECDKLKQQLETELGRDVEFNIDTNDTGELYDLLDIARKFGDTKIENIILQILECAF